MRRWQVLQTVALVLVFGRLEGALDAHELAGHRGPTYEVTHPLQLEPGQRRLKLTILDADTGEPTAARFSVTIGGQPYTPESLSPGGLRFVSIHVGKKQRFVALYCRGSGPVDVPLPDDARGGEICVAKGLEYLPEVVPFDASGETAQLTVTLSRWTDVRERGWRSVEEHLHYDRLDPAHDADWLTILAGDDLDSGHFLMLKGGNLPGVWAEQYAYGAAGEASDSERLIRPGEEYRDSFQGHINLLGLGEVIEPIIAGRADYPYNYPPLFDVLSRGRESGGIVGQAHGAGFGRSSSGIADTVLGAVDFFEIANTHLYKVDVWYRLMNCGYVVPPVAGTDLPNYPFRDWWQPMLGEVRTYVRIDGRLDFESFKAAVRRGETFISCGPMIRLWVDGVGPGGTVRLAAGGGEVLLEAELSSPRALKKFEVLHNARPLEAEILRAKDGRVNRWRIRRRVRIDRSGWLAAWGGGILKEALKRDAQIVQNTVAHTAAVRVLVGDEPITSAADARFLIDRLTNQIEYYRTRAKYEKPEDQERALGLFESAIEKLSGQVDQ